MNHLQDEALIAHFYREPASETETGAGNRFAVESHLADCAACSAAYAALRNDLATMKAADLPARDAAYGERVWRQIAPSLPAYEPVKKRWLRMELWRGLGLATACTVMLAGAFFAGRLWEQKHAPVVAVQPLAPQPAVKQHVVVVVLSDHLDSSERLLVELKHADPNNEETLPPLRDEARALLAANRICQKDSELKNDPQLAAALNRLDQLLDEMANRPEGLNAATLVQFQQEMNAEGLLFEVRVLRSRVEHQEAAKAAQSLRGKPQGGTI
jgi:hypothetical protein